MNELEQFRKDLSDKGCNVERFAVIMLGAEQLVGEVDDRVHPSSDPYLPKEPSLPSLVNETVSMRNPKRYIRLQKVTPQGISVEFCIGGLDGIVDDGSVIQVRGLAGYYISHLGPQSQINFLRILRGYYEMQVINRAAAAGLALPQNMLGGPGGKG